MRKLKSLLVTVGMVGMCLPTQANIVTFSGLAGPNGSAFTNYSEVGFDLTSSGGFVQAFFFGNPIPDIFAPSGSLSGAFTTVRSGGGTFVFNGVDIANANGQSGISFLLEGFLGAGTVFSSGSALTLSTGFSSYSSPSNAVIDRLRISYTTATSLSGSVLNVDNINVSPSSVPEPGTLTLFAIGASGLTLFRRRRNSK